MDNTRILVAGMPRLFREIMMDVLGAQPDMEVIAEVANVGELVEAARRTNPAIVVIDSDDALSAAELLMMMPRLKIFAVSGEKQDSWLYELRPHRVRLCEISPGTLVEEIRRRTAALEPWGD